MASKLAEVLAGTSTAVCPRTGVLEYGAHRRTAWKLPVISDPQIDPKLRRRLKWTCGKIGNDGPGRDVDPTNEQVEIHLRVEGHLMDARVQGE